MSWKRIEVGMLLVLLLIIYHSCWMLQSRYGRSVDVAKLQESLKLVVSQLMMLRRRHNTFTARIKESPGEDIKKLLDDDLGPTAEYELLKKRIYSNTKEFWYFVRHALGKGLNENLETEQIQCILEDSAERKRSLLSDQEKLPALDGYEDWRRNEAARVSDLVQRRLRSLQNPPDCPNARKLVCQYEDCGFGCQHHHLVYCLTFAYATKRTLILNGSNWEHKDKDEETTNIFHPLSETCTCLYNDTVVPASAPYSSAKVISLSMLHEFRRVKYPKFLPINIPQDIARRVYLFNSNPTAWWIGQMLKYILKPQSYVQAVINDTITKTNFDSPIVGVHVQCSDKVEDGEAKCQDISEYMSYVEDYYAQLELTRAVDVRRVYLATDDTDVLNKAVEYYPQYIFYGYYSKTKWKDTRKRHYKMESLTGLLVDLHMLSLCYYVVGTFSGDVGRMVYELMQTNRMDASNSFSLLDHNIYNFLNKKYFRIGAIRNTDGDLGIAFNVGDHIDVKYNYMNGTGYGTVLRTHATGLIPWYKTAEPRVAFFARV